MEENIIYGKTTDGRDIALDGYRVESFTSLSNSSDGGEIIEVVFKSGKSIQVISVEDDKGDSLWCDLVSISRIRIPAPMPSVNLTDFTSIDGSEGLFDCNAVEFLISWKSRGYLLQEEVEYVELHFASGRTITAFPETLQPTDDGYGDNVVLDFINRYSRTHQ